MLTQRSPSIGWISKILGDVGVSDDLLSAHIQDRRITESSPQELVKCLSVAFYEIFHAGILPERAWLPRGLRHPDCEQRLAEVVPHSEITVPVVIRSRPTTTRWSSAPQVLVERDGVRVWVPEEAVPEGRSLDYREGVRVPFRASPCRPALSPGFFFTEGSRVPRNSTESLRMYFHVADFDSAIPLWEALLTALEDSRAEYQAKVLSSPLLYPRRDAIVVYLSQDTLPLIAEIAAAGDGLPGLNPEVSHFARPLRPGVSVAWEPADPRPGRSRLSFGQHRASVFAKALVDAKKQGEPVVPFLKSAFVAANIDPLTPFRNLTSPTDDQE